MHPRKTWTILLFIIVNLPRSAADFRGFVRSHTALFKDSALALLQTGSNYPPLLAIRPLTSSHWGACHEEGRLHHVEVSIPRVFRDFAKLADNASADFILVPHCFGNKHSYLVQNCLVRRLMFGKPDRSRACSDFARKLLEPYFRAWVGELRRAGPRALVVLTFAKSRLFSEKFEHLPYVMSYVGPTDWLARHDVGRRPRTEVVDFGCGRERSSEDDGRRSFFYPNKWPQDMVLHAPSPFFYTSDWRPAANRHILFVFAGANVSCLRASLLARWVHSSFQDVHVSDTGAKGDLALHVRGAGDKGYSALMQRARFCLVPDGHVPWSYRFLDALHHGCVPCVLSESWHPPLHRLLRWKADDFPVVFLHPSDIPRLHEALSSIEIERWAKMQALTLPLAAMLDFRTDTAYEALLAELSVVASERNRQTSA